MRKYTVEDIEFLKEYYPVGNWEEIYRRFPNATKSAIQCVASRNGVHALNSNMSPSKRMENLKSSKWTEEEIGILKNNYSTLPMDLLLELLPNRNKNSIACKARSFMLLSYEKIQAIWKRSELEYIVEHWKIENDKQMAQAINKTQIAVRCKRTELGLLRWNGSQEYEDIIKYIRGNIYNWKVESMKNCNYECVITGRKDFQIHHLYSVNDIFHDTVKRTEFTVKENFDEYTKEELDFILNEFIYEQSKYPLGICVTKDIHKLFHATYGRCHNTKEQWDRFVKETDFSSYYIAA